MKRRLKNMLIAAGLVVLAIVVSLFTQVDDWSRDLSTNRAATSANASDPSLLTLKVDADQAAVRTAILKFAEQSPTWSTYEGSGENAVQADPLPSISLVRTTRLFRFKDDIKVFLSEADSKTTIDVTSQSRVGKGDLGQNPRNIRELLTAIRLKLQ